MCVRCWRRPRARASCFRFRPRIAPAASFRATSCSSRSRLRSNRAGSNCPVQTAEECEGIDSSRSSAVPFLDRLVISRSDAIQLLFPAKFLANAVSAIRTQPDPQGLIRNQPTEGLRQFMHISAADEEAVFTRTDELRNPARPVSHVRYAIGPGFEQDQPERIRTAGQSEKVDAGKEIPLLLRTEHAQAVYPSLPTIVLPKTPEIRHFRTSKHHPKTLPGLPELLGGPEQVDTPFLPTVIRQVSNHDLIPGYLPLAADPQPIASGTLGTFHPHAEQNQALGGNPQFQEHGSLQFGLYEHAVGHIEEGPQSRTEVSPAGAVVGIIGVAEMQKWREQERNVQLLGQAEATDNRPGIGKCGGVDQGKRWLRPLEAAPHPPGDWVARQRPALPAPVWEE